MGIEIERLGPAAKRQILAKLGEQERVKASKYHSQPAERGAGSGNTIRFDSQKEARRYDELMLLLKAGKIRNLKLQPQFTLQESYITPEGKRVRAIRYIADYTYFTQDGVFVVEDVKGHRTREYIIKKKMMFEKWGIEIIEV